MNKKIFILILLLVVVIGKVHPNLPVPKCEITGLVKDSISGEVLEFASVQLFYVNESKIIKGTLADIDGNYRVTDVAQGNYRLVVSYMGYNNKDLIIDVKTRKMKLNFSLSPKNHALSEVEISSEKNLIEKSITKTAINVSKDATVVGGTAVDVIQTLPSVDIDIDGNINYRGSDKVIILLNC